MITLLAVVASTVLLHALLIFLLAFLVALVVFYAVCQFVTDARIRNVIGLIIALLLLIVAVEMFAPGF